MLNSEFNQNSNFARKFMKYHSHRFFYFVVSLFINQLCHAYGSETLFMKFPNKYFIESGTFTGNGVRQALNTGLFEKIHTIELSVLYYTKACHQFKYQPQVILWQGDSGDVLDLLLKEINAPATFWLDAHYSGGNTAKGSTLSPILKELKSIGNHPIKNHVILIDDVRQFGSYEFDYVTLDQIVSEIMKINPNYQIEFLDCPYQKGDVLAAYVRN